MVCQSKKMMIIAEMMQSRSNANILELFACIESIRKQIPISTQAVLLSQNNTNLPDYLTHYNIDITHIELPDHAHTADPEYIIKILMPRVKTFSPDLILSNHSSFGLSIVPLLGFGYGASCITGVKEISISDGNLIYSRLIWNGKYETQVSAEKKTTAITVLTGFFTDNIHYNTKGKLIHLKPTERLEGSIELKDIKKPDKSDCTLDHADVIVAAGRGIGDIENLDRMKKFSKIFQRSSIGGSRPLIDLGWLPYPLQVGVTGKTVRPKIYIACGISGSSQHIAGMSGAEYIIAINIDPQAAIFNVADLCIVEDMFTFIDAVLKIIRDT
jgi:electron transfer flavoprotein alpha subunit